jgi:predicted TIM-barrel fold metal-dependent hydrolase
MVDGGSTPAIVDHILALGRRRGGVTPVIDGHHHICRQADPPWLVGPMQPRIFGPCEPIRRDYPIEEFRADFAGSGGVKSVYVQANWPPSAFEDDAAGVQRTAERAGWPHAIVAYADMNAEDVRPQLDWLARYPLVRGARMQLHWHENAQYRFAARPDLPADTRIQRNIRSLADYDFTFDLQAFAPQMAHAADLAEPCPKVTFILQHAGMLEDLTPAGRAEWRAGMVRLAACPNVRAKLSGLGTFLHRNDPEHVAFVVRETVGIFGADRCLFGSNFPIEKLWASYGALARTYRDAISGFTPKEQQPILHDTAMGVYRIAS